MKHFIPYPLFNIQCVKYMYTTLSREQDYKILTENMTLFLNRDDTLLMIVWRASFTIKYYWLITALLIGGWVPETSKSFHYWQPAPRWRPLPWLANPGNPAMSPHTGKENRYPSHWVDNGKREGMGGEKLPGRRAATPCNATSTHPKERLQHRAQGNSHACTHAKTIDY